MGILWLDTETYSERPLKEGTYIYAENCEVDIIAYAVDDGPAGRIDVANGPKGDVSMFADMAHAADICVAHNAMFDRNVLRLGNLKIEIPIPKWRCSMVRALAHGLPGSLDKLGEILDIGLDYRKMKRGKELMLLFCKPRPKNSKIRRATKATDPALWAEYLEYATQDVVAMRAICAKLPAWNYTFDLPGQNRPRDLELAHWHRDQQINDRGFYLDLELVDAALRAVAQEQARLKKETRASTGYDSETGEGLGSTTQRDEMLRYLLEQHGVMLPDMRASTLERRLEDPELDEGVKELLRIRLQVSSTSTSKYKAMRRGAGLDWRMRGTIQFDGAARTRRAAGRTVQPQNFPSRGLLPADLIDLGIQSLLDGSEDLLFPDVMKLTTSTIRPCISAPPGKKLVVSDLSNIEGRGLAWLAGEEWKLQAFRDFDEGHGPDLYKKAYGEAFRIPPNEVSKFGRQIGKVMELACFAPGTKVLTDSGYKAIVEVLSSDKLWDGAEWVQHQGVVEKGVKRVVSVGGMRLTPDHLVLTGQTWTPAHQLVSSEKFLSQALVTGSVNLPSSVSNSAPLAGAGGCGSSVLVGRRNASSRNQTSLPERLHGATAALKGRLENGVKSITGTLTSFLTTSTGDVCSGVSVPASTDAGTRMTRGTGTTEGGGYKSSQVGYRIVENFFATWRGFQAGITRCLNSTARMSTRGMNLGICGSSRSKRTATTSERCKPSKPESESWSNTFDILNAGALNRFTVLTDLGPVIVHNCGYAGGIGAFVTFANVYGIDLDEMADAAWETLPDDTVREAEGFLDWQASVGTVHPMSHRAAVTCEVFKRLWRAAHPATVKLWKGLEDGFRSATQNPGETFTYGRFKIRRDGAWLRIVLPSGRALCYPSPRVDDSGKLSFTGINQYTRKYQRINTYSGKLAENCTQSFARDILYDAMPHIEDAGYEIVLHVHDEVVTEVADSDDYTHHGLSALLATPPAYALDMPLAAAGYESYRYKKD